jgi:transcriptional regulator with PAS, ATPase and Fis domain
MVKVNCAAIPENLLESELFGHEKGAFTGAVRQRIGRFEEAGKGTLFLDEIGEMPSSVQAKLLRILQDGTFQRVGSNAELKTNVRVLAATNRNLEKMVEEGKFREDLFYRLNVMEIYIPPLRDRTEDILPLANRFAAEFVKGRPRFSSSMSACLLKYPWPGNVRELRNAMERASLLSRGELIMPHHLPNKIQKLSAAGVVPALSSEARIEDVERAAILQALQAHQYNRTETARALGISRRNLLYKLQRYKSEGHPVDAP